MDAVIEPTLEESKKACALANAAWRRLIFWTFAPALALALGVILAIVT
jgi:hypothetical protein